MRWTLIIVLGKYFVSFQQKKLPFIQKKKVASKSNLSKQATEKIHSNFQNNIVKREKQE